MTTQMQSHQTEQQSWKARMKAKLLPGVDADPFPHVLMGLTLIENRIEELKELGDDGNGPELHLLRQVAHPALAAVIGVLQECNAERGYQL